ncbi:MAG: hypothetical protein KIT33_06265 [Candidatus Kapabacteria bacterium]|nr:hypothetical protein [Ignavibacteriota bacterium]MCW5884561.1 hypothetical protein [Candidatus Kapabacteria bacterium]
MLLIIAYSSQGFDGRPHYSSITVDNGLSQNSVLSLYQDENGFIWAATSDGLNRFDGYEIKIFRHSGKDSFSIKNNFINNIFHSNYNGFWLATDDGISFYDDLSGKFYNYLSGYKVLQGVEVNKSILCLTILSDNFYKVFKFDVLKNQLSEIDEINNSSNRTLSYKIKKDFRNRIWIFDSKSVYQYFENGDVKRYQVELSNNELLKDFEVSGNGKIFVATKDEIIQLDENMDMLQKLDWFVPNKDIRSISSNFDNLFVFHDFTNELTLLNLNKKKSHQFYPPKENQLLYKVALRCMYIDKSGIVWLGTEGGGIAIINLKRNLFNLLAHNPNNLNSLSVNFPKGLTIDAGDNLWITTIKGGINKYDIKNKKWSLFSPNSKGIYYLPSISYQSILEDLEGTIWAAGENTIDTFNLKEGKFINFIKNANSDFLHLDFDGNIWFRDKYFIRKYNKSNKSFSSIDELADIPDELKRSKIFTFINTQNKNLWFGTDIGLIKIDLNTKSLKKYSRNDEGNSLSNNYVLSLFSDSKNRLWVTTRDGLNIYRPDTDDFFKIGEKEGLANTFIYGILEDINSHYWISSNKGLSKLILSDEFNLIIQNFTKDDGLQSNEFNTNSFAKSKNGYLFFGGIGGITYFHPDSIIINEVIPDIVITKINLFDMPLQINNNYHEVTNLVLNYFENTLSFEFSGLEFTNTSNNQYAYFMVGVDTGWVYSGEKRFARYANLKPGKYLFKVKASNNHGLWNEKGKSIQIEITPPFWSTIEFKVLSAILLIILVTLAYKIRMKSVQNRNIYLENAISERTDELKRKNQQLQDQSDEIISINESLEERVRERTLQLEEANHKLQEILKEISESKTDSLKSIIKTQEDERSRFAKDLHDGASQYLTFLKFNINNVLSKLDDGDIKENLKEQVKLIDNIVKELRQFAYALMPPVLERIGLKAAIEELVEIYKSSTNVKFEYYLQDKQKPLSKYYKIQVYRVVQEIINNAVKHSNCTRISIQLLTYPSNILIIIEDNGKGFKVDSVKSGMGLKNIYSRLALINGKIDIDSQINHGTTITIEVPN